MRDLGAELLGLIPLDADDEGLNPVGVQVSVADIYQFFESRIQAREVQQAREILAQKSKR